MSVVASAMAGRSVDVAAAAPGSRTWTDGRSIYLEPTDDPRESLRLLAVQASLLSAGSLDRDVVATLRGHRRIAARYLAVEGHRALADNEDFLPPWMHSMIDRDRAERAHSPTEALAAAQADPTLEPPWVFGALDPRRVVDDIDAAGTTAPAPASTATAELVLEEVEESPDDAVDLGGTLSSPVGGGGPIGRLLAKLLRPSRSRDGGGPPGGDAATHTVRARPDGGRALFGARPTDAHGAALDPGEPTGSTYPEWDVHRSRYRDDWCHVVEEDSDAVAAPSAPGAPDTAALRRSLARLGMGLTPCRRQRQGDDIDIDAAVEARVDHLAGVAHADDTYIETLRRRRDLSVLVLLDVSGSAGEPGVGNRTVHQHQLQAATALTAALHELGDRVALHAFSSSGRKAVRVTRVKGFDQALDGRTLQRAGGLRPGGYTRLGAAIRHGTALLDQHGGTPRRLLVVLSDGFAYDHGYEGRYGEADAHRSLLEARQRGIGCLCLSVGAVDTDLAALRRVFGAAAHASVPTVDLLPALIGPLFAGALSTAEAQRRRFQRTERTRERLELEGTMR
jgi:nitric oxide reductase NorD protein